MIRTGDSLVVGYSTSLISLIYEVSLPVDGLLSKIKILRDILASRIILLMAEILHQLIGSISYYL